MIRINNENIVVYDNQGKTVDRYTICLSDGGNWAVFTMSDDPSGYIGINMYSHHADTPEAVKMAYDKVRKAVSTDVYKAIRERMGF